MLITIKELLKIYNDSSTINEVSKIDISEEVCLELIENYPEYKSIIAYNKNLSNKIIEILSDDESEHIRFIISQRNKLSLNILDKLSKDKVDSVRMSILNNKNITEEILQRFTKDPWVEINNKALKLIKRKNI